MSEQMITWIGFIIQMLWGVFIALIIIRYSMYKPHRIGIVLLLFALGLAVEVLFTLYFGGPYLLRYFR